jgi:uncharacterized membrane protein
MKILAGYLILGMAFDAAQVALAFSRIPNTWVSETFSPIQFVLLMWVFYVWNKQTFMKGVILASIPLSIVAWTVGSIFISDLANTETYMDPICGVILILVSSYTLLRSDRLEDSSVLDVPAFWVSSATIIYSGGTVVLSSLSTSILKTTDREVQQLAWSTQSIVTIIANLMFARAFLCLRRKT